jgi:hypothetical protein
VTRYLLPATVNVTNMLYRSSISIPSKFGRVTANGVGLLARRLHLRRARKAGWNQLGRCSLRSIWLRRPRRSCLYFSLNRQSFFSYISLGLPRPCLIAFRRVYLRFVIECMFGQSGFNNRFEDDLRHPYARMRCLAISPYFNMQRSYRQ